MKSAKTILFAAMLIASIILSSCQTSEINTINSKLDSMQASIARIQQQIESQAKASPVSATQTPSVLAKVITGNSIIRSKPDSTSAAIETLFQGEIVKILEVDVTGKWVMVESPVGSAGWISAQQIFTSVDLNAFIKSQPSIAKPPPAEAPKSGGSIDWSKASSYIGEYKTVCGPVIDSNYATSIEGAPTFLDIGKAYPDAGRFTVIFWEKNRGNFPQNPESFYNGKTICVYGLIQSVEGTPEIEATKSDQIQVQ
jgi:hypothetical protein